VIGAESYRNEQACGKRHLRKMIRGDALQKVERNREGRGALPVQQHLLIIADTRQQALADVRASPCGFFESVTVNVGESAHPLRGQTPVLQENLTAFFAALKVSAQFGELGWREASRGRQSTTLLENIVLV
jgi:hypothetical protein